MYLFGDTYFELPVIKNVFQAVFISFIVSEMLIWFFTSINNRKCCENKEKGDKNSCLLLVLGVLSTIFFNVACRKYILFLTTPVFLFWIGTIFIVAGVFLRIYSVWTLGKFFTLSVQVTSEQKIIQTGPYKYLRHPSYSGSILSLIGISFCFRNIIGIILTIAIIAIIYKYRIRVEEKMLEKTFSDSYKEYKKRTKKIIPFIW
ncbi:isoprenylcysteine carboxylmethyltransferase family protein [Clostridium sp. SHJSY1]|uniref:methyltransferase family protein n=1 Tax=Clostridium sp. SHJSY1 TaxID=2942483 RepID=UPI002875AD37|nr:isoprenylcysteine carboxylmethyltransferase family protein [Clostridium sp. SHJSY1]MDS0527054.1 isoprenylcysteine carboxylmethyltransferase family protein [Clostridium sp. SHJSY1]